MSDFKSGLFAGKSKLMVMGIAVAGIAALAALSWYTGLFAALS